MSKLNRIKELLQSVLAQFAKVSTDKGLISWDGDALEVGMPIMVIDDEGNESKAPEGDYTTEDGTVYVVDGDGKLAEIREPEESNQEMSENEPDSSQEMEDEAPAVGEPAAEEQVVEENVEETPQEPEENADNEPQKDERDETIANLEADIDSYKSEIEQLTKKIEELEAKLNEPAADPATDQFDNINKVVKTGHKGLDNLNRILNA